MQMKMQSKVKQVHLTRMLTWIALKINLNHMISQRVLYMFSSVHTWVMERRSKAMFWTHKLSSIFCSFFSESRKHHQHWIICIILFGEHQMVEGTIKEVKGERRGFPSDKRKRPVKISEDLPAVGNSAIYRMLKKQRHHREWINITHFLIFEKILLYSEESDKSSQSGIMN